MKPLDWLAFRKQVRWLFFGCFRVPHVLLTRLPSDKEILNRIFTMIDEVGDEQINFKVA